MHSGEQCSSAPSTSSTAPWSPCAGVRKVLVIGAGVAGLLAAKHLRQAGYSVLLLEQADDVGGVWVRNYHGFGLQGGCTAACVGRRPSEVPPQLPFCPPFLNLQRQGGLRCHSACPLSRIAVGRSPLPRL